MCYTPFTVKHNNQNIPVPCGKCPKCYKRRISGWSYRLMQEDKRSISAHFITLTYDTKNVHITPKGFMGLNKRDLQLFFKRLRKAHDKDRISRSGIIHPGHDQGRQKIRYYAVGEYGGKTYRPHYHIILFNAKLELIQEAWGLGQVHYGEVSGASIGYTLKYMSKPSKIPLHKNDDRQKEFSLMSKELATTIYHLQKSVGTWRTLKTACIARYLMAGK